MAEVAKRSNFNLKAMLRDLFLNVKEFYSEKAMHALIKNPVYYAISAIRLLQAEVATAALNGGGRGATTPYNLGTLGMMLFNPPDVFGWPGGVEWSTTSFMLARANLANALATNRSTTAGNTGIPLDTVLATGGLGAQATAEQVVDYFASLLVQRPLAANVRQALVDYLKKADNGTLGTFTLDAATKDKKVRGLIHLLLTRPEAQNFGLRIADCGLRFSKAVFVWERLMTTRRDFIKTGAGALGAGALLSVPNRQALGATVVQRYAEDLAGNGNILVIVELAGGCDPLNTIVPLQQYDTYAENPDSISDCRSANRSGWDRGRKYRL